MKRDSKSWLTRLLAVAAIAAACMVYATRYSLTQPKQLVVSSPEQVRAQAVQSDALLSQAMDGLVCISKEMSESRGRRAQAAPGSVVERSSTRAACVWGPKQYRSNMDLAQLFVGGAFVVEDFIRHTRLNPRDEPLCPQEAAEIAKVVDAVRRTMAPLVAHCDDTMMREKIAMIEGGVVQPWLPKEVNTRGAAQELFKKRHRDGKPVSLEAAQAIVSKNSVLYSGGPEGGSTYHKGKWYSRNSFPELVEYSAAFERLRFAAMEASAVVFAWFVHNGFMPVDAVAGIAEEFYLVRPS